MSLLQGAAQTFSKRSVTDNYGQVAKWLLIGLAMAISRKSWHLLSKHRTCAITPLALLRVHFVGGYVSTEQDDKKKPYAATFVQAQQERAWELLVNSVIRRSYCAVTNQFEKREKQGQKLTSAAQLISSTQRKHPLKQGSKSKSRLQRLVTKVGPPRGCNDHPILATTHDAHDRYGCHFERRQPLAQEVDHRSCRRWQL